MTVKKKIIISIVFFLVLSILLIVFLIYPVFLEIKKTSQDFLAQKEKLTVLEQKVKNLEKFRITFSGISSNLEKIDNFFVDPEVPIDFIRFLEKTSQDSQLSLKISPGQAIKIKKDESPFIVFQLSLTGSFPNLAKFLEKLESASYLIEIQNLTITRLKETELTQSFPEKELGEKYSLGDINAVLSIKVYTK